MSQLDRRAFLGHSLKAGVSGALAHKSGFGRSLLRGVDRAALTNFVSPLNVASITSQAPAPPEQRSFVSRPDLTPPGVTVVRAAGWVPNTPGCIFLSPRSVSDQTARGLMIIDRNGELVWYQPMKSASSNPFDFQIQTYKGQPVITWFQGTLNPNGYGAGGTYEIYDTSYEKITSFKAVGYPSDLHEFQLTPEDTALVTAYEVTSSGLVIGHAQEIDVATKSLVFDWACYPEVATSESYVKANMNADYFHLNSIALWPGSARNLLVSGRDTCAVYLIDRQTKSIIWRLHGKKSNWDTSTRAQFWYQHDARPLPDGSGLSLFDDASQGEFQPPETFSSGKVITLNSSTMKAHCVHQFKHTDSYIDANSQGSCRLLPNNEAIVGWGSGSYFSEFVTDGTELWGTMVLDGRLPSDYQSYRAFTGNWNATPKTSEIALAVVPGTSAGQFVAFMTWNGSTNVAAWGVAAGTTSSSLSPVTVVPKGGFETPATFTSTGATSFQATAYSASGQVLGQSHIVNAMA